MRSSTRARLAAAGLLVAAFWAPARGQTARESAVEERAEVNLRSLRFRVEPTALARPGECLDLSLDALQIRLHGEPVANDAVVAFARDARPAVHALLIDASGSMAGRLEFARQAAIDYVRRLRGESDRAMLVGFEDNVTLLHGVTEDRDALTQAIQDIRVGGMTTIRDALFYTIGELQGYTDRAVVLLLTDGHDTASFYEEDDLYRVVDDARDVTIFTVGVSLPHIRAGGPGPATPKKFLQKLAARTNGKFFDVPTASQLERAYLRIRELLDNEWILTVLDRRPDQGGGLKVALPGPCRIKQYRSRDDPEPPPVVAQPGGEPPYRVALPSEGAWHDTLGTQAEPSRAEACRSSRALPRDSADAEQAILERGLWIEVERDRLRGCALDLLMEDGPLYDSDETSRVSFNGWIELGDRPFQMPLAPPEQLPTRPELVMNALARHAREAAPHAVKTDARKQPAERHARPYRDIEALWHGKTFLVLRGRLASALYLHPSYRTWVGDRLEDEVSLELRSLVESFRRHAPDRTEEDLWLAAYQSAEGQAISARAATPTETDLQRHLAAWLGDIAAHDLFRRWEITRINAELLGNKTGCDPARFHEDWRAAHRLFFVPSYTRVLTPLFPGHDPQGNRIGFWRVILPRTSWMELRVQDWQGNPEYRDLPLDLLPPLPLGYWTLRELLSEPPALARYLSRNGFRVLDLRYQLGGKARHHGPRRAFEQSRLVIVLQAPGAVASSTRVELTAEVSLERGGIEPRLQNWKVTSGDETPVRLSLRAQPRRR